MAESGWCGKILRIDLSSGMVQSESTKKHAKRFIGGRGIGVEILFHELSPTVHPFDPENILIFSAGPLVGTIAPLANRIDIESKNAVTGGIGYSNAGGHFAPELKYAGYDHIVIFGRSPKPVYLWIRDDQVEIRDASSLWGKGTGQVEDMLRAELDDPRIRIASIGPAGENRVFASAIIIDKSRAAGGCGLGSIMGSKNLKAIAVRGTQGVTVSEPEKFLEESNRAFLKIYNSNYAKAQRALGSHGRVTRVFNEKSALPVRNAQDDHWDEAKMAKIDMPQLSPHHKGMFACLGCPMPCSPYWEIKEGPYAGTRCEGFQANAGYGFGPRFDIEEGTSLIKATELCNQLGLDIDNSATVLSWAFELFEKGILTEKDTGGYPLKWGVPEALLTSLKHLAYREGLGEILSNGFRSAGERIGRGSEYFAMHIKGQGAIDSFRTAIAWGFGHATSTRGARHLDGSPTTEIRGYTVEIGTRFFDVPTAGEQGVYEGKAKLVSWFENMKALFDSLGLCYFGSYWGSVELLGPDECARLFSLATGEAMSGEELLRRGRQIHDIEKAFNTIHAGFTRKDDLPPMRVMVEPVKTGPLEGLKLDWSKYNRMLDEYYAIHDWDLETGWQTRRGLESLGLEEVAETLEKAGRIRD